MAEPVKRADLIEQDIFKNTIESASELEGAIKALVASFSEMAVASKKVIENNPLKSTEDIKNFNKESEKLLATQKGIAEMTEIKQKLNKEKIRLEEKLKSLSTEQAQENAKLKKQIQEQNKALRDNIKEVKGTVLTIDELNKRNRILRKEIRSLNLEDKNQVKLLKEKNKEIEANTNIIKENSDKLVQQKMNIGNYSDSILNAVDRTGILTKVVSGVGPAFKMAQKGMAATGVASTLLGRTVSAALISTGIGALLPLIGSLVIFLTKSEKGALLLERAFSAIQTVVNVVIDRISSLVGIVVDLISGKISLVEAYDKFKTATTGVIDEMKEEVKITDELTVAKRNLRIAMADLNLETKLRRAEIKELNKIAEDETAKINDRVNAARKANEIEKQLLKDRLDAQLEHVRITLEMESLTHEQLKKIAENKLDLATLGLSDSDLDDYEKATETLAGYFELIEESKERETTMNNKFNTLIKRQQKEMQELFELDQKADEDRMNRMFDFTEKNTKKTIFNKEYEVNALASLDEKLANQQEKHREEEIDADKKRDEEKLAEFNKQQELYQKSIETTQQFIKDAYKNREKQLAQSLAFEQNQVSQNIAIQQELAAKGLQNTLAQEKKRQFELEQIKERQRKRDIARQEAMIFLEQVLQFTKDGETTQATTKALTQVAITKGIATLLAGSAFEGTEDTGGSGGLDGKGGKLWMLHPHERVLSKAQNDALKSVYGKISNDELVKIAVDRSTTKEIINNNPTKIENKINIGVDEFGNFIEDRIEQGQRKIIKHINRKLIQ